MTSPAKMRFIAPTERVVRAWEAAADGEESYEPVTFPVSSIERIRGNGQSTSIICLHSGTRIFVDLPFAELEQRIYQPHSDDMDIVDLRSVTTSNTPPDASFRVPGKKQPDGSIYLTHLDGQDWYVTGRDAHVNGKRITFKFNKAAEHVAQMKDHGRGDWRIPPHRILKEMAAAKDVDAFKGTYHLEASLPAWYLSSTEDYDKIFQLRIYDDEGGFYSKTDACSLRCVRAVTRKKMGGA